MFREKNYQISSLVHRIIQIAILDYREHTKNIESKTYVLFMENGENMPTCPEPIPMSIELFLGRFSIHK